jgi:hypothetical protein
LKLTAAIGNTGYSLAWYVWHIYLVSWFGNFISMDFPYQLGE